MRSCSYLSTTLHLRRHRKLDDGTRPPQRATVRFGRGVHSNIAIFFPLLPNVCQLINVSRLATAFISILARLFSLGVNPCRASQGPLNDDLGELSKKLETDHNLEIMLMFSKSNFDVLRTDPFSVKVNSLHITTPTGMLSAPASKITLSNYGVERNTKCG